MDVVQKLYIARGKSFVEVVTKNVISVEILKLMEAMGTWSRLLKNCVEITREHVPRLQPNLCEGYKFNLNGVYNRGRSKNCVDVLQMETLLRLQQKMCVSF